MPWKESLMSQREEFVVLAITAGNRSVLCRRFGISRKTGYKWLARYGRDGPSGLADRSRRPSRSPTATALPIEHKVLAVRRDHPAWGGRKIRARLLALLPTDEQAHVPAASTITEILRRHGLLQAAERDGQRAFQRFEHAHPNDLWQMDFKGHFGLTRRGRCHPLTVLDDHSRFAVGLRACGNEKRETVKQHLSTLLRRYGMPRRLLMDNGPPWGDEGSYPYTRLTVWLIRLGIAVTHGRPRHPQTQGKDERFHRTLKAELLRARSFCDLADCQRAFDSWRDVYNLQRPHEALAMAVPASRYQPSGRQMPSQLPAIAYAPGDVVRRVHQGYIRYAGREIWIGMPFVDLPVALRPTPRDGVCDVYFCHQRIGHVDLRQEKARVTRCPREPAGGVGG